MCFYTHASSKFWTAEHVALSGCLIMRNLYLLKYTSQVDNERNELLYSVFSSIRDRQIEKTFHCTRFDNIFRPVRTRKDFLLVKADAKIIVGSNKERRLSYWISSTATSLTCLPNFRLFISSSATHYPHLSIRFVSTSLENHNHSLKMDIDTVQQNDYILPWWKPYVQYWYLKVNMPK